MNQPAGTTAGTTCRRVVVGVDVNGRSHVVEDGPVGASVALPPFSVVELWRSTTPAALAQTTDGLGGEWSLEPPRGGCVARIVELRPDSEWRATGSDDIRIIADDGFHKTDTLDFVAVIEGELWCVLDDGEVSLRQGDVLVQPGTNHAWSVRGDQPCRLLAVLVDGER